MSLETKPTRPQRVPSKRPKPVEEEVKQGDDIATPTALEPNKYAPRQRVGRPTLGAPNRVESVGLGGLKTITNYGNQSDVRYQQ